jgi:4-hydroxy-tetrahydrodipicolinate reductase
MTNITILGYGQMGKVIEGIVLSREHKIVSIIDTNEEKCVSGAPIFKEINEESLKDTDVVIDFTAPDTAISNIKSVSNLGKNIVVGTTGWYDKMSEVEEIVKENGNGVIWSGNFSIGVNAFFRIIEASSKIFNKIDNYDVMGLEYHHKKKADSPSGTAKMIADIIVNNIERKDKIVTEELKRKIEDNELHFASVRGGSIPGTHEITFDSKEDSISLKHTARGREGFAYGAVLAAEFIHNKNGFYSIDDLMKDIIDN